MTEINPGESETPTVETFDSPIKIVEASGPMNLAPPDPNARGPWIEYLGVATVRVLKKPDWASLGIDSNLYAEWNYLNQKMLPASLFNEAQIKYLLEVDGRFQSVTDEELAAR